MYEIKSVISDISKIMKQCEQSELNSFAYQDSVLSIQFNKTYREESFYINPSKTIENVHHSNFAHEEFETGNVDVINFQNNKEVTEEYTIVVKSPFVGTVEFSNQIKLADEEIKVKKGDVICSIEAMKIYNDLKAPVTGTIVQILVDDCSLVEYEQPVFKIRVDEHD